MVRFGRAPAHDPTAEFVPDRDPGAQNQPKTLENVTLDATGDVSFLIVVGPADHARHQYSCRRISRELGKADQPTIARVPMISGGEELSP
jgi:hypothetical protein